MMKAILRLSCLALLVIFSPARAAQLVKDINSQPASTMAALPTGWSVAGGAALFLLDDGVHGMELWRSDGTVAGTTLVKDINPGPAGSGANSLTVVGGILYFFANDGTNGQELWRSDGTAAGTHIVADINPGPADGAANAGTGNTIPTLNGVLYFDGTDPAHGMELWRSDGTAAGTYLVTDIAAGAASSSPTEMVAASGRLYFTAFDGGLVRQLYVSDGTGSGTSQVGNFTEASGSYGPTSLTPTTAGLFFVGTDSTHGTELHFVSAGGKTASLVADLTPGMGSTTFGPLAPFGSDVIFAAVPGSGAYQGNPLMRASGSAVTVLASLPQTVAEVDPPLGMAAIGGHLVFSDTAGEVWSTDGTASGTQRLGSSAGLVATGIIGSPPSIGSLLGSDGVYFFGREGAAGNPTNLWRTDGTAAGTIQYAALPQPFVSSDMAQLGGKIVFAAGANGASATGLEPWTTDGTAAGTQPLADLVPGPGSSDPAGFVSVAGHVYFTGVNAAGQYVLYASDGTTAGTIELANAGAQGTQGSSPQAFTPLGSMVLFVANDGVDGNELWITDGTTSGTTLLKDIAAGSASSNPSALTVLNSTQVVYLANDVVHGLEPWVTDGTTAGTHLILDIYPGTSNGCENTAGFVVLDGVAYFDANDGVTGDRLWRTDGTPAGTYFVPGGPAGAGIADLQVANGRVLFRTASAQGTFWWSSDGTANGTQQVSSSVYPASQNSVVLNGYVYFGGQAAPSATTSHVTLWRTDGTAAGTTLVLDPLPNATQSEIGVMTSLPSRFLFQYCYNGPATGASGCSTYGSDGTAAGTASISPDLAPGNGPYDYGNAAILGNNIYYTVQTTSANVLRTTDGTLAGTRDVLSTALTSGDVPLAYATIQGYVLFSRNHPTLGPTVWRTDGIAAGTLLVADINNGVKTVNLPSGYTLLGQTVLFNGSSPSTGAELYALSASAPSAANDAAMAVTGAPANINVIANDGSLASAIDPTSVRIVTAPSQGTATVNNASGVVTYTAAAGFSGTDQFTYTVANLGGVESNPATVYVMVAEPAGPAPGTAPSSSSGGGSSSSSGSTPGSGTHSGGGGGQTGVWDLAALAAMATATRVKRRRRTAWGRLDNGDRR